MPNAHRCRLWFSSVVLPLALLIFPLAAQGQESGRRFYEEELRVRLDEQAPEFDEIGYDAGGWFSFAYFRYDDEAAREQRNLRRYELRGWASMDIRSAHRFYVRGLLGWDHWTRNPDPDDGKVEFTDFRVERAWYEFDLRRWLTAETGEVPPVGFRLKVGRQYAEIGTGLTLAMPMDMLRFELSNPDWDLTALLGQTIEDTDNIDDSPNVSDHQERCFWGFELAYKGIVDHRPFIYYLHQDDHTSPRPRLANQSFDYSSRYLGVGSTGTLTPLSPYLHYRAELVGEWGKTYSMLQTAGRDRICAMAGDVQLAYTPDIRHRPRFTVGYLFATGDDDRAVSATSTIGGNVSGTKDRAFNAFGYRDTGIAFAPRVSNLHMYSAGASCFPLEDHRWFRKMQIGTRAFFYHKDEKDGPTSDVTSNQDHRWLGWEWDVYCDWRITSDLSFTTRYGAFWPGEAFADRSCRQFIYTGVIFTF
ncbi:MAG: alginate export family protein [Phycisphaerae bacterium]